MIHDGEMIPWPYPVQWGTEKHHETDVLVIGGGIAGVWAAIAARRAGMRATIMEKADTRRSGAGGAGCDHWQWAADNPNSAVTPEELTDALVRNHGGYRSGISTYIQCASGFETLLELERMGGKIRDTDDEFSGAPFRDEASKLLYAYDYDSRFVLRVWGANWKPILRRECKKLGVQFLDRCTGTALLTERGRHGARVIGATGLDCHTGAFVVARAKAVILATNRPQRIWTFSSEHRGLSSFRPPSNVGSGYAMGWRIGAEFTMMEKSMRSPFASPYSYPPYGSGNAINTWYPCSIIDADGKEIPWVDAFGRQIDTIDGRCRPAEGQKFFIMGGGSSSHPHPGLREFAGPTLIRTLEERVARGEYKLPLYADLTGMPDYERRVIWGLMIGQEGKTKIPVLETYTKAGFDPARDMLQTYEFLRGHGMREPVVPQERTFGEQGVCGGLLVDWDLMSNIPGLFGAGDLLFGGQDHSHAATTGRYAGARAALYARTVAAAVPAADQIEREKARVYAPLADHPDSIDWKELNAGVARVMQNYCAELKSAELLHLAEIWLEDIQVNEVPRVTADNPHKLMRTLDVFDIVTCAQMIVHACQARKASSDFLHVKRIDHPEVDPPEWNKFITIRRTDESAVVIGERPLDFCGDFRENYLPRHAENMAAASASVPA